MARSNTKSNANQQLKNEIASELGINLQNGDQLTTKQAGSVGGNMVKKMVAQYQQQQGNK